MNPERSTLRRAIIATGIALGILAVAAGGIAWVVGGVDEAWAATAGVGVAAFVSLSTLLAMLVGSRCSPTTLAAIVFGSYLVKVAVLLGILWGISRSETFPRVAFGIPLVLGAVVTLSIDVWLVSRARVPYVSTGRGGEAG